MFETGHALGSPTHVILLTAGRCREGLVRNGYARHEMWVSALHLATTHTKGPLQPVRPPN